MLALALTAELNGVTDLKPTDTADSPYYYTFKVQCTSCRETHANWVGVSRHRESSATIRATPSAYEATSPARSKNVIEIDTRGLEFTDFKPDGDWEAVGIESGTKFTGIDLTEGEWFDYDEKAGDEDERKSFTPVNPRPLLQSLINEEVVVRLKWGQTEYKGVLVSIDSYMNIQLHGTEEYIDRKHTGTLGQVLIRCNNVLWISAAKGVEMNGTVGDTKMEG
ncbi:hypothetical protein H2198_002403 [Neophaeococcomyces mojaviensis]|uniref:Uncharacterized protein n=1 Tax=Neophaeococcomyces mojaviensis TaxID=3383035 RepID=A0ACC3AER2_9EURO|nr:hypothetical protein H2198_002403 [Knufia sp. JES_112]